MVLISDSKVKPGKSTWRTGVIAYSPSIIVGVPTIFSKHGSYAMISLIKLATKSRYRVLTAEHNTLNSAALNPNQQYFAIIDRRPQ